MKSYVMFGHGNLFSDLLDIIRLQGGTLKKVVLNLEEPTVGLTISQRLSRDACDAQVVKMGEFVPSSGEEYVFGFIGSKRAPLALSLSSRFGMTFATLVHPSAIISPSATLAPGSVVNAGSILAPHVFLAPHAFVNRGATIGHDTTLSEFSVLGPGAHIAGNVSVGKSATICLGAKVAESLSIAEGSVVAAGAVVLEDVPAHVLVAGIPAKVVKQLGLSE